MKSPDFLRHCNTNESPNLDQNTRIIIVNKETKDDGDICVSSCWSTWNDHGKSSEKTGDIGNLMENRNQVRNKQEYCGRCWRI